MGSEMCIRDSRLPVPVNGDVDVVVGVGGSGNAVDGGSSSFGAVTVQGGEAFPFSVSGPNITDIGFSRFSTGSSFADSFTTAEGQPSIFGPGGDSGSSPPSWAYGAGAGGAGTGANGVVIVEWIE